MEHALKSPEHVMTVVSGQGVASLSNLAVRLARGECLHGEDIMASSAQSGGDGAGVALGKLDAD